MKKIQTLKAPITSWKPCIDNPFQNCSKIFPTQQKNVKRLIDVLKQWPQISKIYIFGSSVTPHCRIDSDVDIYVEIDGMRHAREYIDVALDFAYDIWDNMTIDDRLKKEIASKGVMVYERNQ